MTVTVAGALEVPRLSVTTRVKVWEPTPRVTVGFATLSGSGVPVQLKVVSVAPGSVAVEALPSSMTEVVVAPPGNVTVEVRPGIGYRRARHLPLHGDGDVSGSGKATVTGSKAQDIKARRRKRGRGRSSVAIGIKVTVPGPLTTAPGEGHRPCRRVQSLSQDRWQLPASVAELGSVTV